jgi:hypothetical protein
MNAKIVVPAKDIQGINLPAGEMKGDAYVLNNSYFPPFPINQSTNPLSHDTFYQIR